MRRSAIPFVVLLVALGLAAACSKARSDQAITTEIQSKMFSDRQLKAANISVDTKKGEVTLRGDIPSDAARYRAFKLASETPGVTKVVDHMWISDGAGAPSPSPPTYGAPPTKQRHKPGRPAGTIGAKPPARPPA